MKRADEIQNQIAQLMAEADALNAKANEGELTSEEQARLEEIVTKIEGLQGELATAQSQERLAAAKDRNQAPARPAPKASITTSTQADTGEGLRYWLASQFGQGYRAEHAYRMGELGFNPTSKSISLPVKFGQLNHKKRTALSTGGAASGAETIFKTYSDKVVEFMSYESPFIGTLSSETADGNERTYYKVDATALVSTKTSASGGSETAPTIPEKNAATAKVVIKPVTFTSGYQRITYELVNDGGVNLWDRMAGWNALSHARAVENEVINGAGTGSNGSAQGLLAAANELSSVAASSFDAEDVEVMYYKIPAQYRQNAMFLVNDATAAFLRSKLKDDNKRTLFDRNIEQGIEWDVFMGKKFYVSAHMPDDVILYFCPDYYQLLFGATEEVTVFSEKFYPDRAIAGLIRFSGAWLGPTGASGAIHSLEITS